MSNRPQDRKLTVELATAGFAVRALPRGVLNEQPTATYYRPDGTALPNLPADAYSQRRYRGRGFTLTPPEHPIVMSDAGVGVSDAPSRIYVCETCNHEFETKIALFGHKQGTHQWLPTEAKTQDN